MSGPYPTLPSAPTTGPASHAHVTALPSPAIRNDLVACGPIDMLWSGAWRLTGSSVGPGDTDAKGGSMIRELLAAAAITGSAIGTAPCAAADPGHYDGDVPGMNYDASLGAPCDNYERFIFGRGPSGQAEACHFPPPNQFPAATTGYWVASYALYGVQQTGAKCPGPQSAAQTADGLPMLCLGAQGWQPGWFTGAGFFPPAG